MEKSLDFKTACMIAGYKYKLTDGKTEYEITGVSEYGFDIAEGMTMHGTVPMISIGMDYWILARDFSKITLEEIKNILKIHGVSLDHLSSEFQEEALNIFKEGCRSYKMMCSYYEQLLKNNYSVNFDKDWWKPIKE